QWNFVRDLKKRIRRKEECRPGRFDLSRLRAIGTVREFDEAFTAPYFGFRSAEDYYHRASAMRVVDRISVPALVITAEDDPFVPAQPFRDARVTGNPHIDLRISAHGGHCGFVGASTHGSDVWRRRAGVRAGVASIGVAAGAGTRAGSTGGCGAD